MASSLMIIISLKHSRKCQIFLAFILKWFVEYNVFTFKNNSILSARWPQLGPGLIMGTSHRSAKMVNIPGALKYKGIRCCV